jgi:glycosyltransferase involved in cell wall biosynthesis
MAYRVALIASHVIQYQDPFFRLLAAEPNIDLTVLFCSRAGVDVYHDKDMGTTLRWDLEMLHGYRHEFLRNVGRGDGYPRLINPGIIPKILFGRYDAVIFFLGWGTVTSLLALAACRMSGTPVFMFGDSFLPPPEDTPARRLRAGSLRTILGMVDAYLVSGFTNAQYYEHYGADPRRFFLVPWAIDNERFAQAARFEAGERDAMRAKLGIGADDVALVFSAKFIPRKDPITLLRAVSRMEHRQRTVVVFLGNGELREEMEHFAREHGVRAVFPGFINQRDLPKHYAMADVFVLPSLHEPRGSVTNEAMAVGLPLVITDQTGAVGDIVLHGDNAFVFPAGDADALAQHLDKLAGDAALRERMAARSREIIATWTYARGVTGVHEALRATC